MASQFGSFNRSPLGAFIESPLGARGGRIKGQWFLAQGGANEWVSDDGITWNSQPSVVPIYGFVSLRGFNFASYTDSPYTSSTAFSGFGTQLNTTPIRAFSKIWACDTSADNLYYSSDNGANWSTASLPTTDGTSSYAGTCGNVIRSSTGRLMVPCAYGTGPAYSGYIAYSDDGVTWVLSDTLGFSSNYSPVSGFDIYQQNTGNVYALAGSGVQNSTDDGETFSSSSAGSIPSSYYTTFVVMPSDRVVAFVPNIQGYSYSDDNFATSTSVSTYSIFFDEINLLYAYRTDTDLLYRSTDGSTWSTVATSPSTLVNGSGRPVRVGMYR